MKLKTKMLAAAGLLSIGLGAALASQDHAQHGAAPTGAAAAAQMTTGELRKVDTEQGKLTIKHEPIANLDMPAMTMVFRAAKPEMLKDLKPGDKIQFNAESIGGAIVVTHIQAAN